MNLSQAGSTFAYQPPSGAIWQKINQLATPNPSAFYNGQYVNFKGALVVQAAGNGFFNAGTFAYSAPGFVADPHDGVLVVGGLNQSGTNVAPPNLNQTINVYNTNTIYAGAESGSNYGPTVEVWGPSTSIRSTWGLLAPVTGDDNGPIFQRVNDVYGPDNTVLLEGTSMAAPYVVGVAAAILQREPSLNSQGLETRVRAAMAARPIPSTSSNGYECGYLGCYMYGVVNPIASAQDDLVEHSYAEILGRNSDAAGKAFWLDDLERMRDYGADPREIYRNLNKVFFWSPEYVAQGTTSQAFVNDVYLTYLNRAPDSNGLGYWAGLLDNGSLNRDAVLGNFQKDAEFNAYMTSKLGTVYQRAEITLIMDAYRGFLSKQTDDYEGGLWKTYLREAQCGQASVAARAAALVNAFVNGKEYGDRHRTDAEFVADMFDAVLGRGADPSGFGFWVSYTAANNRAATMTQFLGSWEWNNRVSQIAAEPCIP